MRVSESRKLAYSAKKSLHSEINKTLARKTNALNWKCERVKNMAENQLPIEPIHALHQGQCFRALKGIIRARFQEALRHIIRPVGQTFSFSRFRDAF